MTECFNVEFKEQLPELAAERLDPATRARVEEHVAACTACADELEILRIVRNSMIPVPFVNVSRIVRVLPPAPVPVRDELPWYRRASIQMAAAFLLVAGGLFSARQAGDRMASAPPPVAVSSETMVADQNSVMPPGATSRVANAARGADISLVDGFDDMTTQELTALLQDVEEMAAVPVAEPEQFSPVSAVIETQGED